MWMWSWRAREPVGRAVERAGGIEPTREQARSLRRYQKHQEAEQRRKAYEAIPKAEYRAMSGLTDKTILSHRDRYGLSALDRTHGAAAAGVMCDVLDEAEDFIGTMFGEPQAPAALPGPEDETPETNEEEES